MNLYERLNQETTEQRNYLLTSEIIQQGLAGDINIEQYVGFLTQAYHHVKHTVPLLMSTGAHLPQDKEWLREAVAEYIEEEMGHQEWILNDIAACGYDKEQVRASTPELATEIMVAFAYDSISRISPLTFFGMVHVLEGTSIAMADQAASAIQQSLKLPDKAFSYLRSHGALDIEHVKFFADLMNRITDCDEQDLIVSSAKKFYLLYANIFRSLEGIQPAQVTEIRHVI